MNAALKTWRVGVLGGGSSFSASGGESRGLSHVLSERLDSACQMAGALWKRDTSGGDSWTLRRFVLKDAFLLYYAAEEGAGGGGASAAAAGGAFNMHPKGVVPLDGVEIEAVRAGPKPALTAAVRLTHPSFGSKAMLLCAKDDAERDRWITALTAASVVCVEARARAAARHG